VWVLGFVSLLMDVSSELIHSLLPLFLVTTLGATALEVGVIEGLATSTALIIKVFSGVLSDYLGKRKGLALLGYGLGALTKPFFALATTIDTVLAARLVDRIGKGIRGAPRDALVADSTPIEARGAAFGLRHALDATGAMLGPLLGVGFMLLWADHFRTVFWVASIPALASVTLLALGLHEPSAKKTARRTNPIRGENLKRLARPYWWVVGIGVTFTLARFSEAFLILKAQQSSVAVTFAPLVVVVMSLAFSLSAYPFGKLSDRVDRKRLLAAGFAALVVADLVLATTDDWRLVFLGALLWGVHLGMTQGLLGAMVARFAPADLRGTAYGFFNLACGIAALFASVLAGLLWSTFGASYTFFAGSAFGVVALIGITGISGLDRAKPYV
jgi:MFS family permease